MWTAELSSAIVEAGNAAAVKVTLTYTNDVDGSTETQTFSTASPESIASVANEWIAQRNKIAAFAENPPLGPIDLSAAPRLTVAQLLGVLSAESLASLWASPNAAAIRSDVLRQDVAAVAHWAALARAGNAITQSEYDAIQALLTAEG